MTLIPFAAAAAAPAAGPSASVPSSGGPDLGAVFSALVDTLSDQFLATQGAMTTDDASAVLTDEPGDVALGAPGPELEPVTASLLAMLLGHSTPDVPAALLAGEQSPGEGDLTASESAPAAGDTTAAPQDLLEPHVLPDSDVVPDTDVAPELGADDGIDVHTDRSFEAAVTDVTAVEDGDVTDADAAVDPSAASDSETDDGGTADAEATRTADAVTSSDEAAPDAVETLRQSPAAPAAPEAAAQGSAGTVSTAPTTAVDGASPVAPPGRTAPPALPDQLVTVLAPLRSAPDGTHRVAIQLRPDELGEVLIDVRVRGNEIALNLRADLAGTADLLRASLTELRADLEAAGFHAGDLDVAGHGPDGAADEEAPGRAEGAPGEHVEEAAVPSRADDQSTASLPPTGGLDLRL